MTSNIKAKSPHSPHIPAKPAKRAAHGSTARKVGSVAAHATLQPHHGSVHGLQGRASRRQSSSLQPLDGRVRIAVKKHQDQLKVKVSPLVPTTPVVLYNQYSQAHARYFDVNDEQQTTLQNIYAELKRAIAPQSTDFIVHISDDEVTYRDERGNPFVKKIPTALQNHPELMQKVEEMRMLVQEDIWKGPIFSSSRRSKHNPSQGSTPLMRTNDALHQLPSSPGADSYKFALSLAAAQGMSQAEQDAAMKRIGAAEALVKHLSQKVKDEITALTGQIQANPGDQNLTAAYQRLQEKKGQLLSLDFAAIYPALAFYPTDANATPADVAARAENLTIALSHEIEERTQKIKNEARLWISDSIPFASVFKKQVNVTENRSWPLDAGALVFSGITDADEAERAYGDYCKGHDASMKGEVLANAVVRAVVKPNDNNALLNNIFEDLTNSQDPTNSLYQIKQRLIPEVGVALQNAQAAAANATPLIQMDPVERIKEFRTNIGMLPPANPNPP